MRGRCRFDERAQLPDVMRAGERLFIKPRLKRVLDRDHQLDALQ